MGLQQISVLTNVQKSQFSKKACKVDDLTPVMVYLEARRDEVKKRRKRCENNEENGKESDEEDEHEDKENF